MRDLRQDLLRCVDEHPPLWGRAEQRVVAHRVAHEIGQLGERFDPRIAGADEDERQLAAPFRVGRRLGRGFQSPEDVVAEIDGVGERLEPEAVLAEPRDRQGP